MPVHLIWIDSCVLYQCVCMCVCMRERREKGEGREREREEGEGGGERERFGVQVFINTFVIVSL